MQEVSRLMEKWVSPSSAHPDSDYELHGEVEALLRAAVEEARACVWEEAVRMVQNMAVSNATVYDEPYEDRVECPCAHEVAQAFRDRARSSAAQGGVIDRRDPALINQPIDPKYNKRG